MSCTTEKRLFGYFDLSFCNRTQGQKVSYQCRKSYHDDENHSLYKVDWKEDEEGQDVSAEYQYATNDSDSTKNALSNSNVENFVKEVDAFHAKCFLYFNYNSSSLNWVYICVPDVNHDIRSTDLFIS